MARRTRKATTSSGGLGRVKEAANKKGKRQWLKLDDGDELFVRVLDVDDEWKDAYCHRTPIEKEGGDVNHIDVPCLDQDEKGIPCPGCKDGLDRRYKFWTNVIVRDWDDGSGKEKDTLMIWSGGITIARRLDKLHGKVGLQNRDIEVSRTGSGKNDTKYEVDWATDENEPLSDNDKKLMEERNEISRYSKPPEYDDFYLPINERGGEDEDDEETASDSINRNAFAARKKKRKSTDEDDEDEAPRRSAKRGTASSSRRRKAVDDDDDEPKKTVRRRRR